MEVGPQFRNMKIDKRNNFENDIVIIDGLWGSGKSLLSPIVSGMDNMVKTILVPYIDQINILINESYIEKSVGNSFITNELDRLIYENQMGRNLNYRIHDVSGLMNNPNILKDIKRLFKKDIDYTQDDFKNSAISIMTHMFLISNDSIIEKKDNNIMLIECVRNPVFAFDHWFNFLKRFNDKKIFHLGYYRDNKKIPWFARTWAEKFDTLNEYDKTLASMIYCYNKLFSRYKKLHKNSNIFFLPFESLVYDTDKALKEISVFTGRDYGKDLNKILKRQKIPRKNMLNGTGYSKYGYKKSYSSISDKKFLEIHLEILEKECDNNILRDYKDIINNYNLNFK